MSRFREISKNFDFWCGLYILSRMVKFGLLTFFEVSFAQKPSKMVKMHPFFLAENGSKSAYIGLVSGFLTFLITLG